MTGADIKALNTEIRGGREMADVTFYSLVNMEKRRIEQKRPWRFLLTEDTANSSSPSSNSTTQYTLPSRFIGFPNRDKLKLVNTADSTDILSKWTEIKFEQRLEKQKDNGYFAVDLAGSKYYLMGTLSKSYTHHLFYIKSAADITDSVGWTGCPDDFAKLLAFAVAVIDESGMDYDEVNARQATGNSSTARAIESAMIKWDDQRLRDALQV